MFKKILSIAIALFIVMGMAVIATSAAQVEVADDAADTPAEVGADAPEATGAGSVINFDASTSGWGNYKVVMVYVYRPDTGEVLISWGSQKKGKMTESNGVYSYDFSAKNVNLESGVQYSVIFNTDTGAQTHDLLFTTECFGDTAYCDSGRLIENPADSGKKSVACYWKKNTQYGPMKTITSLGNVVGDVVPAHTTNYGMFVSFLTNPGGQGLSNAITYADGATTQQIIDKTGDALGLTKDQVKDAIEEAKSPSADGTRTDTADWSKDWSYDASTLPGGSGSSDGGDNGGSGSGGSGSGGSGSGGSGSGGSGSGGSGSGGSGSGGTGDNGTDGGDDGSDGGDDGNDGDGGNGGGNGGNGGGSGSGGSGGGDGSQTGQEPTVLFIMLGVMVAAAGVIFFARKKTRV